MAEDEIENEPSEKAEPVTAEKADAKKLLSRRNLLGIVGVFAISVSIISILIFALYRNGVFDTYIKDQFVSKMSDIGISFDSEVFRVSAFPLSAELRNANFTNGSNGEKLFFIRDLRLDLTIFDLLSLSSSREIGIDAADVTGAEVWVKFDENGVSNFAGLKLVEDDQGAAVKFKYDAVKFSLRDSVVHFGDISRDVSGDALNLSLSVTPESAGSDNVNRYKFDIFTDEANFVYNKKAIDDIDLRANGVADENGAEILNLTIRTPIGTSELSGKISNWAELRYDLDIQSTADIAQIANLFSETGGISGIGNFRGRVIGSGENYQVVGTIDSESLRAAGVYLKAVNVEATVEGTNLNYVGDGTAVAEMLTFEDFRIDFPKLVGNVRGTGTDFRWFGELQAIAARSPSMTLGGLFLSDAVAEYKDRLLQADAKAGRVKKFSGYDISFENLDAKNLRFVSRKDGLAISASNGTVEELSSKDLRLTNITGDGVRIEQAPGKITVGVDKVRSSDASIGRNKVRGMSARDLKIRNEGNRTEGSASAVSVNGININGASIEGLESPLTTFSDTGGQSIIYSDKLRVAKIDTGSAVLGSLNIAGVRLSIRNGTVEAVSDDIDAGDLLLTKSDQLTSGGVLESVKVGRPIYVLESSGRYRATADMSIGGGTVGSITLGTASAKVDINNDRFQLDSLNAKVMDGDLSGNIAVALSDQYQSQLNTDFSGLDLSKLVSIQIGRVIPIEGFISGSVRLSFIGRNIRTATGDIDAEIAANAGAGDKSSIPVSGIVELSANNGLFQIGNAKLHTEQTELAASGQFDIQNERSDLELALRSNDAAEVDRLIRLTEVSPGYSQQLDAIQLSFAGKLSFDGTATGNLFEPDLSGNASIGTIIMRQRELGSVTTDISAKRTGVLLQNGRLNEVNGGSADFDIEIPFGGLNNVTVNAELNGVEAGNLLAALPIDLPQRIRDVSGKTSGKVNIRGLPNQAEGSVDLSALSGKIAAEDFDNLKAKAIFRGTVIELEMGRINVGDGKVAVHGSYDRSSTAFDIDLSGDSVPVPLLLAFLPPNESIPVIDGKVGLTAKATGKGDDPATYDVRFNGTAVNVSIDNEPFGNVDVQGKTTDRLLTAHLIADLNGQKQAIDASINFGDEGMSLNAVTVLDRSPITPYFTFVKQLKDVPIAGSGSGKIEIGGNLRTRDQNGSFVYSTSDLYGNARFTQLSLVLQETPLEAIEPIQLRFNSQQVTFDNAKFSGGGSNVVVKGTKALSADAVNEMSVEGRISLNLLNLAKTEIFFGGNADVAVRLSGPNSSARLSGTANTENASFATFVGSDRLTFERVKTRVIFTENQAEINEVTGYLGGGRFRGSGGASLSGISVRAFRFSVNGDNITVPLPKDFQTTGDARLEITGSRNAAGEPIQITVGGRVFARRILYSKDIELANVIGARREASLTPGPSSVSAPKLDLVIEGRDALVVRNNIADLTASVSLALTGDADNPRLTGRITANSGTLLYRKDRYNVQRGVLEFPPDTLIEPVINLQAETDIGGYQIFINLSGPLNDTELLTATIRSSPALPQADVVSLITTGTLTNTAGGISTLAQSGINTAASILTDSVVNNPARRATDKLFGLNVFEIAPIISSESINPGARLTVGRQINNNLRVTYATDISQDQKQVVAVEYRVSNRLSFIAQYEQRSISNVTNNRNNFGFEIRFRRRF